MKRLVAATVISASRKEPSSLVSLVYHDGQAQVIESIRVSRLGMR